MTRSELWQRYFEVRQEYNKGFLWIKTYINPANNELKEAKFK